MSSATGDEHRLDQFMNALPDPSYPEPIPPMDPPGRAVVGGFRRSATHRSEIQDRVRAKKLQSDQEAIHSFVADLYLPRIGKDNPAYKHTLSIALPSRETVAAFGRTLATTTSIALRARPVDEISEDDKSEDCVLVRQTPELVWARSCYRGKTTGEKYHIAPGAYGWRDDLDADFKSVCRNFTQARVHTVGAHHCVIKDGPFAFTTLQDGVNKIQRILDGSSNNIMYPWVAEELLKCIRFRMKYFKEGARVLNRIESAMASFQSTKGSEDDEEQQRPAFSTTFSSEDLMGALAEALLPRDASRLIQACRWTPSVRKILSARFPRLHIYEIPSVFPHFEDAAGKAAFMHKQTTIKVAVGLVATTERQLPAAPSSRPSLYCYDAAYTVPGSKNVASWTEYDQAFDPRFERTTLHPSNLFNEPPDLTITLVDLVTDQPVLPMTTKEQHGGLVPQKAMARCEARGSHARLQWNIHSIDENPRWSPNGEFAVMSKFHLSLLSSRVNQSRFKIRAEVRGVSRLTGRPLHLSTYSDAFSIVSSLAQARAAAAGGGKRKRL